MSARCFEPSQYAPLGTRQTIHEMAQKIRAVKTFSAMTFIKFRASFAQVPHMKNENGALVALRLLVMV